MLDRLGRVEQSLAEIRRLPLENRESFEADSRNGWTAESCLRRALLDVGRHLLAKLATTGVAEYKAVGRRLGEHAVLDAETADLRVKLSGYRNRLVHFYREITAAELFGICAHELQTWSRCAQPTCSGPVSTPSWSTTTREPVAGMRTANDPIPVV